MTGQWSQLAAEIRKMTSDPVRFDVPMWRHVTFRIGGPAALFAEPADREDLRGILRLAQERKVSVYLLGGGSNLLVADHGLRGLVLHTGRLSSVTRLGDDRGRKLVAAESGVPLASLIKRCAAWGMSGLQMLAGIPGTVGGAVVMNAGAGDRCMADLVTEVTFCADGSIRTIPAEECGFDYRTSVFQEPFGDAVILGAKLALQPGQPEGLRREIGERLRWRRRRQPSGYPSAGSVFRNPEGDSAGSLIDRAGWKGRRVGGALVAPAHANFIVNAGGATADDVATLIRRIQNSVREEFGVRLELELKTWGVPELR